MGNSEAMQYYETFRHEMFQFIPTHARSVLDVGCGTGSLGRHLIESHGCEVWGVEPHRAAAEEASRSLSRVFDGAFTESLDFQGKIFDVILFNDVLEHMVDPLASLKFAKTLLSDGGVIVSSIPNLRHHSVLKELLVQKSFEYQDHGILDRTHLRFFTSKTMLDMYAAAGLEVVRHEGINATGHKWARRISKIFPSLFGDIIWLQFATVARKPVSSCQRGV